MAVICWEIQGDVLWNIDAVAKHCGITPDSVNAYMYANKFKVPMPKPVDDPASLIVDQGLLGQASHTNALRQVFEKAGGLRMWRASQIIEWQTQRPRPGVGGRPKRNTKTEE